MLGGESGIVELTVHMVSRMIEMITGNELFSVWGAAANHSIHHSEVMDIPKIHKQADHCLQHKSSLQYVPVKP
jgi:hypothetical protein